MFSNISTLQFLLEMLVVLERTPSTTPLESVFDKFAIAGILPRDLHREGFRAVGIGTPLFGIDRQRTVLAANHAGIIQRIDIHRHSVAVIRQFTRIADFAVVECRGVVRLHRGFVQRVVFVDQHHPFDGVLLVVQRTENFHQVSGNSPIADQFAVVHLSRRRMVQHAHIAQLLATNPTAPLEAPPVDSGKHLIGELLRHKVAVDARFGDFRQIDARSRTPLCRGKATHHQRKRHTQPPAHHTNAASPPYGQRATRRATRTPRCGNGSNPPWRSWRHYRS